MVKLKHKRKRRFVVCVTDFGGKGDGVHDDTAAFRAARRSKAIVIKVPLGVWVVYDLLLDHRFTPVHE